MKKGSTIVLIVIIIVVLGIAGYYFIIKSPAEPIIWDGTYKMTGTLTCEGNFPNLTTIPMNSNVVVTNNKIVDQIGETVKNFDIDKRGKATEVIEPTTSQGVTVSGKAEYKFSKKGDVYKFTAEASMDMNTIQDSTTYASTCSGAITGLKQ